MVDILDAICGLFGVITTDTVNKLIDSSALFQTKGVLVGDLIINRTDATHTIVLSVDSETELTLRDDRFDVGDEYIIAGHLEKRWRFSKQDNLLDYPPTKEELDEQVPSALGEINAHPPVTTWTLEDCYNDVVGGRRSLLIFGAAKNVVQLLESHWNNEGFDATIGDLSAVSKFGDFTTMYSQIETTFNDRLEKLKMAKEKYIRSASGDPSVQNILSTRHFWGMRW